MWKLIRTVVYIRKYANKKINIKDCIKVEKGRIWFMGGIDCVLMTVDSWGGLIKGLLKIHGPAILSTMREAYKKNGFEEMNAGKKIVPREKLGALFDMWIETGFVGKILNIKIGRDEELKEVPDMNSAFQELLRSKDINKLIVRVKDSFSVRALKSVKLKTNFPACIIEPSHTCGALEALVGGRWFVEETFCQAKGDRFCEWMFRKEK